MSYKVIKGKNKIRGEQTFVDNITGSVVSASAYYGVSYTGATVSGTTGLFNNLTSSVISASSIYAANYLGLSASINTSSLLITASVNNDTVSFTKGDGSSFSITVNNVVNAQTASYVLNAVSASFATNASTASLLSGFNQNDYLLTSSFNNFTASYNTGSFSGSFVGTASYALNAGTASYIETAQTASYYNTSSLLITSSVSNDTITFTKGNGSTYPITINNVVNAQTASYVLNAVSASFATNAATASLLNGFNQNDYLLTSSFNNFTASYNTGSFSGSFTGSLLGTASFALNATTASYYDTSSLLVTSSVSNANITFTKGDGSNYTLTVNNVNNAVSSSYASNSDLLDGRDSTSFAGLTSNTFVGNQIISGNVDITGIVTANELHITYTTSSVIFTSGSTKFGDSIDDTHQFTGSILNNTLVSGTVAQFSQITGTLFGTASFATNALTASYFDVSNLITTASVSNATITFTKGDASTFPITINNVNNAVSSSYASNADLFDNRNSTEFAILDTNNTFTADQNLYRSVLTLSNGEVGYQTKPSIVFASLNERYFHYVYTRHNSDNAIDFYTSDGTQFGTFPTNAVHGMTIINGKVGVKTTSPNYELDVSGNTNVSGNLIVTGSVLTNTGFTGSLFGTASFASVAQLSLTASYIQTAVSATYAANADLLDGRDSTTFAGTGSNTFDGNQIITGSITSTSTISGATGLFTTITSSQSLVSNVMSVGNYVKLIPANTAIPTDQTASYIYTSGSTNDLYFTQYDPNTSLTNTTRLRWIEGGLRTGLLHGGLISTVNGTTTFNVTSGSGIIVSFNASTATDPYPTIKYVNWSNFVSQSLIYSASAQITYVAIDDNGAISQTNTAFTPEQFRDRIIIGRVLHQTGSVTNGAIATPTTAYGVTSNTYDFIRAFGPLKISGQVLAASGSTLGITKTAGDSYVEGRNYATNQNIPNYVLAANDPALTTTKIFYEWVSGSSINLDTNGGVGYSAIRPAFYNNNGTVTAISPTNNKFTVQRVYWFPASVTRAFYVYYGSTIYTTLSDALAAVADEPNFVEGDNTKASAVYLGAIVLEANTSDLTVTTKAKIVPGGLFRGSGAGASGGGGGGSTSPGGANHEIQYNDAGTFNGSPNLTFDTTTLTLTGDFVMVGTGSINIDGGYITGSLAQFTTVSGSVVTGSTALFTQITGNLFGTASHAILADTASYYNTSSLLITASVSNATITFSKGDSSTFPITINNVVNAQTASYASNADLLDGRDSTSFAGLTANTFNGDQTITGSLNLLGTLSINGTNVISGTIAQFTTITGSTITGSIALFTQITGAYAGSGANLTSIPNAALVNSSVTVGTTSISLGSSATTIQGISVLTGSTVTGSTALFTQITGNLFGTASYATTAGAVANGVYTNGNNTFTGINTFNTYYITGSITGSDAKFTSITGSHAGSGAGLTNIPNAALTNSSVTVGTTVISLGSSATTIQGISVLTGSTVTGSTALFTNTTSTTSTIGTALYASNTTTTVVGNNAIYNVATASYDGMFVDYTARSGSNARAGQIMAIWSGSSVNYTETTTNDFGTTTGLAMAVVINGTNMQLSASASTANWTVKTIIRTI